MALFHVSPSTPPGAARSMSSGMVQEASFNAPSASLATSSHGQECSPRDAHHSVAQSFAVEDFASLHRNENTVPFIEDVLSAGQNPTRRTSPSQHPWPEVAEESQSRETFWLAANTSAAGANSPALFAQDASMSHPANIVLRGQGHDAGAPRVRNLASDETNACEPTLVGKGGAAASGLTRDGIDFQYPAPHHQPRERAAVNAPTFDSGGYAPMSGAAISFQQSLDYSGHIDVYRASHQAHHGGIGRSSPELDGLQGFDAAPNSFAASCIGERGNVRQAEPRRPDEDAACCMYRNMATGFFQNGAGHQGLIVDARAAQSSGSVDLVGRRGDPHASQLYIVQSSMDSASRRDVPQSSQPCIGEAAVYGIGHRADAHASQLHTATEARMDRPKNPPTPAALWNATDQASTGPKPRPGVAHGNEHQMAPPQSSVANTKPTKFKGQAHSSLRGPRGQVANHESAMGSETKNRNVPGHEAITNTHDVAWSSEPSSSSRDTRLVLATEGTANVEVVHTQTGDKPDVPERQSSNASHAREQSAMPTSSQEDRQAGAATRVQKGAKAMNSAKARPKVEQISLDTDLRRKFRSRLLDGMNFDYVPKVSLDAAGLPAFLGEYRQAKDAAAAESPSPSPAALVTVTERI